MSIAHELRVEIFCSLHAASQVLPRESPVTTVRNFKFAMPGGSEFLRFMRLGVEFEGQRKSSRNESRQSEELHCQ